MMVVGVKNKGSSLTLKIMRIEVFAFNKVNILIHRPKIDDNLCTEFLELLVSQIVAANGPTDPLKT